MTSIDEDETKRRTTQVQNQSMNPCDAPRIQRKSTRPRKPNKLYTGTHDTDEAALTPSKRPDPIANRPYDKLPDGRPFSCDVCKSGFVCNPRNRGNKVKRSKHMPAPRQKFDQLTGKMMLLCNACGLKFNRPRKVRKITVQPPDHVKGNHLSDIKRFLDTLAIQINDDMVSMLYCPVYKLSPCDCLHRFITSDVNDVHDRTRTLLLVHRTALKLSKEKCYTPDNNTLAPKKPQQRIGLGNGKRRSKDFEQFVLDKRVYLRDKCKLCERAVQKILVYSNNFLHKKLKTDEKRSRVKRVRGKLVLGQLPQLSDLHKISCCTDNCVTMVRTHEALLHQWRRRVAKGQSETRRVLAEMLTPTAGGRSNCHKFIAWVTGSSHGTISRVNEQMRSTGGVREPPIHALKKSGKNSAATSNTSSVIGEGSYINITSVLTNSSVSQQQLVKIQQQLQQQRERLQEQQNSIEQQLNVCSMLQHNHCIPQNTSTQGSITYVPHQTVSQTTTNTTPQTIDPVITKVPGHITYSPVILPYSAPETPTTAALANDIVRSHLSANEIVPNVYLTNETTYPHSLVESNRLVFQTKEIVGNQVLSTHSFSTNEIDRGRSLNMHFRESANKIRGHPPPQFPSNETRPQQPSANESAPPLFPSNERRPQQTSANEIALPLFPTNERRPQQPSANEIAPPQFSTNERRPLQLSTNEIASPKFPSNERQPQLSTNEIAPSHFSMNENRIYEPTNVIMSNTPQLIYILDPTDNILNPQYVTLDTDNQVTQTSNSIGSNVQTLETQTYPEMVMYITDEVHGNTVSVPVTIHNDDNHTVNIVNFAENVT